ncbi:hypothetical protein Tco_1230840, partial [Tanacetum coccineum]
FSLASVVAGLMFFSPSVGEVVAWPVEGTPLVRAPDTFSTTVANLFKVSVTLFNSLGRKLVCA